MSFDSRASCSTRNMHIIETHKTIKEILVDVYVLNFVIWHVNFCRSENTFADCKVIWLTFVKVITNICINIPRLDSNDDSKEHDHPKNNHVYYKSTSVTSN